jgi:hypothetical protein
MKRLLIVLCTLCVIAPAALRLQGQADIIGYGIGAAAGTDIVPFFLEAGVEGSEHIFPSTKSAGSFSDADSGLSGTYSGIMSMKMTRVGAYAQLHFPGLGLIPVIGLFANPIAHFGSQNGIIWVDGTVRPINNGLPITGTLPVHGSYFLVGFPSYFGPFFVEPAFGAQQIFIAQYANYKNTLDAQLSMGVKF